MTTQPADWADAASENVPFVADEPEWHARPSAGAFLAIAGVIVLWAVFFWLLLSGGRV